VKIGLFGQENATKDKLTLRANKNNVFSFVKINCTSG
jgi:hypothetical protein